MKFLVLFPCFLLSQVPFSWAQTGCTDPQALNFSASAVSNDGSCMYPVTTYVPVFKASLPGALSEISGLVNCGGSWWAHNDSGNATAFSEINPESGLVIRTVTPAGAHNRDWEDAASTGDTLFIGDFGNNSNNRTDLGIYSIPLSAIQNSGNPVVPDGSYSFIPYAYPDQVSFTTQPQDSTVFDCEAMLFHDGLIHLFSKNHRDYTTTHYTVEPLTAAVVKRGSINTEGMITGADISPDGKIIALAGYNLRGLPSVFCWFLWDWPAGTDDFFAGNKRKIEFGSALISGQVESIAFSGNRKGYIANENTTFNGIPLVTQGIRTFDCSAWIPELSPVEEVAPAHARLRAYPNPASGAATLHWETGDVPVMMRIFAPDGRLVQQFSNPESGMSVQLETGCYFIVSQWQKGKTGVTRLVFN